MGNLNKKWLIEFYLSMAINSRRVITDPIPPPDHPLQGFPDIRILWPLTETAFESNQHFLDSINLKSDYWFSDSFPRHLFYHGKPHYLQATTPPPLSHSKIILRVVPPGQEEEGCLTAWIYVGSANFSKAAVSGGNSSGDDA